MAVARLHITMSRTSCYHLTNPRERLKWCQKYPSARQQCHIRMCMAPGQQHKQIWTLVTARPAADHVSILFQQNTS